MLFQGFNAQTNDMSRSTETSIAGARSEAAWLTDWTGTQEAKLAADGAIVIEDWDKAIDSLYH